MTQKIDDTTKSAIESALEHPLLRRIQTEKFNKAWRAIQGDRELKRARAVLSIHELRLIIKHTADAFDLFGDRP